MLYTIFYYVIHYLLVGVFSVFYTFQFLGYLFKSRNKPIENIDLSTEPSCLKDPTLGTHGTIHVRKRNIEVHYVANGDKNKPLMLFVHGFPEFWYYWKYQLKEFGNDYYAVAMDMTGYGGTTIPIEVSRYHVKELAADVKEFIQELGFESCILVGHDWGGAVSYMVAILYPEVVDKLIVMNCPNKYGFNKGFGIKQTLRSSYMFYFQLPWIPEYFLMSRNCGILDSLMLQEGPADIKKKETFTKEDLTAYKYTFLKGGFTGPLNYYRCLFAAPSTKNKEKREWKKIVVPSLIIWGTDDPVFERKLAVFSAEGIEHCKLEYIEGAAHKVNLERPDEVNKCMREYLDSEMKDM